MAARISYKVDQNIIPESNDLLRIIHNGIDDIILNLKRAVDLKGDRDILDGTIGKTNSAVVKILELFNQFQKGILINDDDDNYEIMKDVDILNNKSTESKFEKIPNQLIEKDNLKSYLNTNLEKSKENINTEADILDLRTDINYNTYVNGFHNIDITNELDSQRPLIERLKNCQTLEELYLRKHKEIIRIFGFVVDLFDKYKYAIKVILFLLKNLVRAENIPGQNIPGQNRPGQNIQGSVGVRLPKPIITGINLLLKDQANIQTIIDGMEKVVNTTHTNISEGVDTTPIQTSLDAQGSPPDIAQQPAPVAP
jgi:hypothetical protein